VTQEQVWEYVKFRTSDIGPEEHDAYVRELFKKLNLAPIDEMVFGGWDLRADSAYEAAVGHEGGNGVQGVVGHAVAPVCVRVADVVACSWWMRAKYERMTSM